jgi:hypothetical protein
MVRCRELPRYLSSAALARAAVLVVLAVAALAPATVLAQTLDTGLTNEFAERSGLLQGDPRVIIAQVIRVLLGFLGVVAVGLVLYGGYLWMTAAGKAEQVDRARKVLTNAFIGLLIILSAFAIVTFILNRFLSAIGGGPGGGGGPGPCTNCSALGGGIIEDHYPTRGATDIARNTKVIITFKEPIVVLPDGDPNEEAQSFIKDATFSSGTWTGQVNPAIFKLRAVDAAGQPTGPPLSMSAVTNSQKLIFRMKPTSLLGNNQTPVWYQATVEPALRETADTNADGQPDVAMLTPYDWRFQVSTDVDTRPPRIVSIEPAEGGERRPRNDHIKVTFDEPVDPLSAAGEWNPAATPPEEFDNVAVTHPPSAQVAGRFYLWNGYRSLSFEPSLECGVDNACGEKLFCLPEEQDLLVSVKAATLAGTGGCAAAADPDFPGAACSPAPDGTLYDGVVDMADNSLDGERREDDSGSLVRSASGYLSGDEPPVAEGPPTDTFTWRFSTSTVVVNSAPTITATSPTHDASGASLQDPIDAAFNRTLSYLTTDNYRFYNQTSQVSPAWVGATLSNVCSVDSSACTNFGQDFRPCDPVTETCQDGRDCSPGPHPGTNDTAGLGGDPACEVTPVACAASLVPDPQQPNDCGRDTARLFHELLAQDAAYEPRAGAGIKDRYGNCFKPSQGPVPYDSLEQVGEVAGKAIDDPSRLGP